MGRFALGASQKTPLTNAGNLPYDFRMNRATQFHLQRLVRLYGSWSQVARSLGLDIRNLRRNRRVLRPPTKRLLDMAGKRLMLRQLLHELTRSGAVTPAQLRGAWEQVSRRNDPSN